jgi:GntR family transcriptional regulator, transcriptional repressor for pyruvate dehydrogenase complex
VTDGAAEHQHEIGVVPRTRAEHLAARLEARIRSLSPGAPLGTIEELRVESGFARATVSEAVRLLADRGVLVVRPGRGGGLFVADQGPVVRMRRTLLAAADRPTEVADAVELRNHLEELIDIGAARRCGEADAAGLRDRLRAMETAPDWDGFVRATWALHERIAALCPNAMARAVYVGTLGHLGTTSPQLEADDAEAYRARRLQAHVELVDAITTGDEDAVRAAVARHHHTD